MTQLTIQLPDVDYQRLEKVAQETGKSVQEVALEWLAQLPDEAPQVDLAQDPIYRFDGYDSGAPADLASDTA